MEKSISAHLQTLMHFLRYLCVLDYTNWNILASESKHLYRFDDGLNIIELMIVYDNLFYDTEISLCYCKHWGNPDQVSPVGAAWLQYWSLLNWRNLRFRCGSIAVVVNWLFVFMSSFFAMFKNVVHIVWSLVRRRVTRRLTRLQTMCNTAK